MVGGAQNGARPDGDLFADADEPARSVHGHAGAERGVLAHLQRSALGVELAAPAHAHAVRKAHGVAALYGEAGSEADLAAFFEQRTPEEQARAHAYGRGNPCQRRDGEFFEKAFHGGYASGGQGCAPHPQGSGAPLTRLWVDDGRGGCFVFGAHPPKF